MDRLRNLCAIGLTRCADSMGAAKYPRHLVERACDLTGKSKRTIQLWAQRGLDLADADEVLAWAEKVRDIVPETKAKLESAQNDEQGSTKGEFDLKMLDRLPAPGEEGAAAALKRLQGLESIFYSRLLNELSRIPSRSTAVTTAQNDYNKVTESLRKYEAAVEITRRDLGHLIPKHEAQEGARAAALWMRLTWRLFLSSAVPDLLALAGDARLFKARAEEAFAEVLAVALKDSEGAKCNIPDWALPVIREEFHVT